MAEQTSLTVQSTATNGRVSTKAISDINPDATDAQLQNLSTALYNLSTNTVGTVNRVNKRQISGTISPVTRITSGGDAVDVTGSGDTYNVSVDISKLTNEDDWQIKTSIQLDMPNSLVPLMGDKFYISWTMAASPESLFPFPIAVSLAEGTGQSPDVWDITLVIPASSKTYFGTPTTLHIKPFSDGGTNYCGVNFIYTLKQ